MGRELKRVPMDFDHPIGEIWPGYLCGIRLPECLSCGGDGYTTESRAISQTFYPHQIGGPNAESLAWNDKLGQAEVDNLVEHGRLRVWSDGAWQQVPRTAEEVNAENRRPRGMVGHDAINRGILVRFRCEQLGISTYCATCEGEGTTGTAEERDAYESWERTDPPIGDGFQMWETTSEGSPSTPVFPSLRELAEYCAVHCTTFGSFTASAEGWEHSLRYNNQSVSDD